MKLLCANTRLGDQVTETESHWVVPVVPTREGVQNRGFKTYEELKNTSLWLNGRPFIPNGHPEEEGKFIPVTSSNQASGFIWDVEANDNERLLTANVYLFKEDERNISIVKALENDDRIEVSIGYHATTIPEEGEFNKESYDHVEKDIYYDHLARVLEGACSWDDGCGLGRSDLGKQDMNIMNQIGLKLSSIKSNLINRIPKTESGGIRENAEWTTAFINTLPDTAFAVIEGGGEKDNEGKTKPRSLRHLPHHTSDVKMANEKESVDLPHLKNALARVPQSSLKRELKARAKSHLVAHAKQYEIGDYDRKKSEVDKLSEKEEELQARANTLAQDKENLQGKIKALEEQLSETGARLDEFESRRKLDEETQCNALIVEIIKSNNSKPEVYESWTVDQLKVLRDSLVSADRSMKVSESEEKETRGLLDEGGKTWVEEEVI